MKISLYLSSLFKLWRKLWRAESWDSVIFLIRRNPIRYLLVNLAVADFMYAAFIAPSSHPDGFIGSGLYQVLTDCNVAWMGAISSIVTLVIISIERHYATLSSFDNKGKFSERKLKV